MFMIEDEGEANLGGHSVTLEIGDVERSIVEAMSKKLVADCMYFVGIDVIADKVEINAEGLGGCERRKALRDRRLPNRHRSPGAPAPGSKSSMRFCVASFTGALWCQLRVRRRAGRRAAGLYGIRPIPRLRRAGISSSSTARTARPARSPPTRLPVDVVHLVQVEAARLVHGVAEVHRAEADPADHQTRAAHVPVRHLLADVMSIWMGLPASDAMSGHSHTSDRPRTVPAGVSAQRSGCKTGQRVQ
jgi:hypothetical protein